MIHQIKTETHEQCKEVINFLREGLGIESDNKEDVMQKSFYPIICLTQWEGRRYGGNYNVSSFSFTEYPNIPLFVYGWSNQ